MNPILKRVLLAVPLAGGPLAILFLGAQVGLRRAQWWDEVFGAKIGEVPFGFLVIAAGPLAAIVYLFSMEAIRRYFRTRLLATAILLAGLAALWSDNPVFDFSGVDALSEGGFSLWGRIFLTLVAVGVFRRVTRGTALASGVS